MLILEPYQLNSAGEERSLFMAYRKKTLRRMSPTARKVARLAGELNSITTRLKNLIPELQSLDLDSQALANAKAFYKTDDTPEPIE